METGFDLMSDNIVEFPKSSDVIFVCSCGCQSFRIEASGAIECCHCGDYPTNYTDNAGRWVRRLPETKEAVQESEAETISVTAIGSVEFARASTLRKIERWANDETLTMVTGYRADGTGTHWFNINDSADKERCLKKLALLYGHVKAMKVSE